jgi:Flp pilus assembly protein TadB
VTRKSKDWSDVVGAAILAIFLTQRHREKQRHRETQRKAETQRNTETQKHRETQRKAETQRKGERRRRHKAYLFSAALQAASPPALTPHS